MIQTHQQPQSNAKPTGFRIGQNIIVRMRSGRTATMTVEYVSDSGKTVLAKEKLRSRTNRHYVRLDRIISGL